VGGGCAEGAPPVRWTVYIRRRGALPPIVLANEKVGRTPARSLPFRHPSVGKCRRGRVDASLPLPLQYVCKSCRLAVTREDCSSSGFLVCLHHRRRRDGLIGSFNPSGHLAECARRPPPPYRRPPPAPPPGSAVRRNYTNISFYINSVYPDVQIYDTSPKHSPRPRARRDIDRQAIFSPAPPHPMYIRAAGIGTHIRRRRSRFV